MTNAEWRQWQRRPEVEETLVLRARGERPEMESTKQLVELVREVYRPGMRVLDVGCNTGHYLRGLRRLSPDLDYTGVDAYEAYINPAREIYADDAHSRFEVRDVFEPLFPGETFDIVYCCNVLLHLPDFRTPMRNLLDATSGTCFVRTLIGPQTTVVKHAVAQSFGDSGEPLDFAYQNTWERDYFTGYIRDLGWNVELIADEFDPSVLDREHTELKGGIGTRIIDGHQLDGNIMFEWWWAKITPRS